jgi:hypothetical protein
MERESALLSLLVQMDGIHGALEQVCCYMACFCCALVVWGCEFGGGEARAAAGRKCIAEFAGADGRHPRGSRAGAFTPTWRAGGRG